MTSLKRFILLIPDLNYKFDAAECAQQLLLQGQLITNGELGRILKAPTAHDKVVELCNILAEKPLKPSLLNSFADVVEKFGRNADLAAELRLKLDDLSISDGAGKNSRIRYYGDFPAVPKAFYQRVEDKLLRESMIRICKKTSPGAIIVSGENGCGVSTLVSRLVCDEEFLALNCRVATVIWLNCASFVSPTTGLFDRELFYTELLTGILQVQLDTSCYSANTSPLFQRLQDAAAASSSLNRLVLAVIDGASSRDIIPLTLRIGDSIRCVTICRDKSEITRPGDRIDELVQIERFNCGDVRKMFQTTFPLPNLDLDSIETLVKASDGLPLATSLISTSLKDCVNQSGVWSRYQRLTLKFEKEIDLKDMLQSAIQGKQLQRNTVELLKAAFNLLLPVNLKMFNAFLLFNPEQPIEPEALAVFWKCNAAEALKICENLRDRNLLTAIRHVDSGGKLVRKKFALNSLLFSIATDINGLELGEIRRHIVERPANSAGENVLHSAISGRHRLALEAILANIDPQTLPKLCGEPTGDQRRTPIFYLYEIARNGSWLISSGGYNETNFALYLFCQFVDKLAQFDKQDTLNVLNLHDETGKSVVDWLIRDCTVRKKTEENALFLAARGGFVSFIEVLLACRVDVNRIFNENGDPAMLIAAQNSRTGVVQLLINSGVDVNLANCQTGYTALMIAAVRNDAELAQLFFDCQANVNAKNRCGDTALMLAAQHGETTLVEAFLENCANVNAKNNNGESALLQVARNGGVKISCDIAWKLLICGGDVNASNNYGYTPLILAAKEGHVDMARLILAQPSVNVNARLVNQLTALMVAALNGHAEIMELILDHVRNSSETIDAQSIPSGETALMMAAEAGHQKVVQVLLARGANVDLKSESGQTAFSKATLAGHPEIAQLFVDYERSASRLVSHYLNGCNIQ